MSEHFDGLWELRGYYTTEPSGFPSMEHVFTLDVNVTSSPEPGADFTDIDVTNRDTSVSQLTVFADAIADEWVLSYPATASLGRFELWYIAEATYDAIYYSTYEVGTDGTALTASTPAHQATWTFRSKGGGWAKLQWMESSYGDNTKISPPYPSDPASVAAIIIAPTSPVLARDNTALFANLKFSQGQNEKLWRKRYRA